MGGEIYLLFWFLCLRIIIMVSLENIYFRKYKNKDDIIVLMFIVNVKWEIFLCKFLERFK